MKKNYIEKLEVFYRNYWLRFGIDSASVRPLRSWFGRTNKMEVRSFTNFRTQFVILKQCVFLRVNGVEMVRFASNPEGGYLSKGMAKVGVRTSCVPGGKTRRFSCVIHKNRFWRLFSSSFDLEVKDEQVHNEIINSRSNHIIWKKKWEKFFKKDFTLLNDRRAN